MTDQIREQMSALLDGELPPGEVSLLVRRMARDAELKRAFGSYVLAGETLRAPGGHVASRGFAARVAAAIEASEGEASDGGRGKRGAGRGAAGAPGWRQ
jgi:sigma-E factor negative regulatory protein RseA